MAKQPKQTDPEQQPESFLESIEDAIDIPSPTKALEEGHDVEIKRTRRDITLKLTEFQIAEAAKKAADAAGTKALKESEFAIVKSRHKSEIEALDAEIVDNLRLVRQGTKQETHNVIDRYDYTDGVVRTVWGGEVVETRAVTQEERQQGLAFIDKKDALSGKDDGKEADESAA